jgi:predicted Zn-dependent peptidase
MRIAGVLCGLLLALTVRVWAAELPVERRVLSNGLRVLVRENPGAGVVAVSLLVRMGSLFETEATAGITNFLQRVMLRGTKARSAVELARAAEELGGALEAAGEVEYAEIRGEALAPNWEGLLALVAEVAREPSFPAEEIEAERRLLLSQIQTRADTPFPFALETLMRGLFDGHPYALPAGGLRASVERMTRDDLRAHYESVYQADRMVLAVSGGVQTDRVVKLARRLLGTLPRSRGPGGEVPRPPAPPGGRRVVEKPAQQAQILLGYAAPGLFDADYAAARVLGALLGSGMSGRLFVELRENHGLAYSVGVIVPLRTAGGVLVSYLGTVPASADAAEARALNELARARVDAVGEDELARAKAYLLGSLVMARRTNARQAWYLAFFEVVGAGWEFPERYAQAVARVSAEDVITAARRYLVRPTVVVLRPPR